MKSSLPRRGFFCRTGALGVGLGLTSLLERPLAAGSPQPTLKATVRDAMLKRTGQTDCWEALKSLGAEGVEAAVGDDLTLTGLFRPETKYTLATDEGIARVKADAAAAGQTITALCMFNRFEQRPDEEVQLGLRTAQAAQALGVRAIRIDVAARKMERDGFLKQSIAALGKLMAATESTGVSFGIENHGKISNDPEFLTPLFAAVGSPRLGLTLDTGNFYWFGHPLSKVYELFEMFAPRAVHTHCKSIRYPLDQQQVQRPMGWKYAEYHCPIDQGDIDFGRVVGILKKAGYANDLCIENESLPKSDGPAAAEVLTKELALLKRLR